MALKIMAVDDEPEVLKLLKALVEPMGCVVVTFEDSREAGRVVEKEKFDGIVLDAYMPHLDGFQLAERIRSSHLNNEVPIVMLTDTTTSTPCAGALTPGSAFSWANRLIESALAHSSARRAARC